MTIKMHALISYYDVLYIIIAREGAADFGSSGCFGREFRCLIIDVMNDDSCERRESGTIECAAGRAACRAGACCRCQCDRTEAVTRHQIVPSRPRWCGRADQSRNSRTN